MSKAFVELIVPALEEVCASVEHENTKVPSHTPVPEVKA